MEERAISPPKSILKKDGAEPTKPGGKRKSAHFDEKNIKDTLHPANKDYGFMKIPECNTPFERNLPPDEVDPEELAKRLGDIEADQKEKGKDKHKEKPKSKEEKKKEFDAKKKAWYREEYNKIKDVQPEKDDED